MGLVEHVTRYVLFGPPAGLVVFVGLVVAGVAAERPLSLETVMMAGGMVLLSVLFSPVAYLWGFVPALVTGAITSTFAERTGVGVYVPVSAATGGAVSTALAMLFFQSGAESLEIAIRELPSAAWYFGGCGAFAGLVCGWLTKRSRPRPVKALAGS